EDAGYFDVDNSNIYFTYEGFNEYTSAFGYGLAEVQNYATSPNIVQLVPIGSIGFWGGVNVGKNGSFVSVIDQDARTLSVHSLPWSSGSPTVYTFGTNAFGDGDPVSGGWNKNDKNYAAGDAYGWLDTLANLSNIKAVGSINCPDGCFGAAYSPSDK
ncbi:MAG TPA: hypothetical protein VN936_09045, partial [Candidatus Acidoferrum sp.]|nr:hypothetical protein [Candidatus Acidoferrum sp.]